METILKDHGSYRKNLTLASLLSLHPFCLESKSSQLNNKNPLDSSFHSRFQSHDISAFQEALKVANTLPQRLKIDNLFKEEIEGSKTNIRKHNSIFS